MLLPGQKKEDCEHEDPASKNCIEFFHTTRATSPLPFFQQKTPWFLNQLVMDTKCKEYIHNRMPKKKPGETW